MPVQPPNGFIPRATGWVRVFGLTGPADAVRATCADTRDEATYRVSVDRALQVAEPVAAPVGASSGSELSRDAIDPA